MMQHEYLLRMFIYLVMLVFRIHKWTCFWSWHSQVCPGEETQNCSSSEMAQWIARISNLECTYSNHFFLCFSMCIQRAVVLPFPIAAPPVVSSNKLSAVCLSLETSELRCTLWGGGRCIVCPYSVQLSAPCLEGHSSVNRYRFIIL